MKKLYIFTLLLSAFSVQQFNAQEITGIATYKSFTKFDIKMESTQVPKELQAQLLESIKQQTQKEYELQFSNSESIFQEKEQLQRPSNTMFSGGNVVSSGGFGVFYKNIPKNESVNQRDLLGKLFLITDTIENQDWKLEKETKSIGDYTCFKATSIRISENQMTGEKSEIPIVAWYTPQIPIANGPFTYAGLPGLILEITDGNSTYLCNQIVLNPKNGVIIESPKKGKNVTKNEFEKIEADKMKEMKDNMPAGNSKTIEVIVGG